MIFHSQPNGGVANEPESLIAVLAILGLACLGIWALARKIRSVPLTPDPWDNLVESEIQGENALPLCHRCLTAHDSALDFCPKCGAAVGQYTNWLPYPYLFSMGHMLRIGTSGRFKKTPLNVIGFVLLAFAEYMIFAPIYWMLLFLKITAEPKKDSEPLTNSDSPV